MSALATIGDVLKLLRDSLAAVAAPSPTAILAAVRDVEALASDAGLLGHPTAAQGAPQPLPFTAVEHIREQAREGAGHGTVAGPAHKP